MKIFIVKDVNIGHIESINTSLKKALRRLKSIKKYPLQDYLFFAIFEAETNVFYEEETTKYNQNSEEL